jgi:hypothetical protein
VSARQEEWRSKIRERRTELMERFGHHTQARDFLAHQPPSVALVSAQKMTVAAPAFDGLAAHGT